MILYLRGSPPGRRMAGARAVVRAHGTARARAPSARAVNANATLDAADCVLQCSSRAARKRGGAASGCALLMATLRPEAGPG